jgi:hypothetical protein
MAATNFTPISLYYTTTAAAAPSAGNLVNGELAINITDGKLYYKDNLGAVQLLAQAPGTGGSFTAPVVIEGTTTSAALRITQLGTGNALLVEDSSNPDASPFVINSDGTLILGSTSSSAVGSVTSIAQINHIGATTSGISINNWGSAGANSPRLTFGRSPSNTVGTQTAVVSGSNLMEIQAYGSDGTGFVQAASISSAVDGTPGTNDMPGRLVFSTTADGASSPTERMRINSAGEVGIGITTSTGVTLRVGKTLTGATSVFGVQSQGSILADATTGAYMFRTAPATQAAAFTLPTLVHYDAAQSTIGAGSAVTTQYGFVANASLTGATNNYGFFSNIASGTGRYNFYAAGTADNYMAGGLGVGTTSLTDAVVKLGKNITGGSGFSNGLINVGNIQSDVTTRADIYSSFPATQATAFTLANLNHFYASGLTVGAGSTVTNQFGFHATSGLTGATNNYGFYSNIASGTGRYNFYANGTADNYFAGNVGIGTSSPTFRLQVETSADAVAGAFIRNTNTGSSASGNLSVASGVGNLILRSHSAAHSVWANSTLVQSDSGFTGGLNIAQAGANPIKFWTNGSERMRLDSSGNLGLGVTPSAWNTSYKAIQNGQSGWMSRAGGSDFYLTANSFNDGTNWKYINSSLASRYQQDQSIHSWHVAPIGTAGNNITFTQAMTLDASGNLGIGTTTATGFNKTLRINSASSTAGILLCDADTDRAGFYSEAGTTTPAWLFTNNSKPLAFAAAGAERMRIDSSGNLLVGTTNSDPITSQAKGISLGSDSIVRVFCNNTPTMALARGGSDGAVMNFIRASTEVGNLKVSATGVTLTGTNGIQFTATQTASADANTLDDYEEGTWTPTVFGNSTPGTYTLSGVYAHYTKIGNQVTVYAAFSFSAASGGTGYAKIGGLPFSYRSNSSMAGAVTAANFNFTSSTPAAITVCNTDSASSTTLYIAETVDNAGSNDAPISGVSTSTYLQFSVSYTVS